MGKKKDRSPTRERRRRDSTSIGTTETRLADASAQTNVRACERYRDNVVRDINSKINKIKDRK